MKAFSRISCIVLLACAVIPAFGQYVYVRSNTNLPWGQTTNESALDSVFGAGNWTTLYYETLDTVSLANLLSSSTQFIFLEGGDSSYSAFATFMQTNGSSLTTWLYSGGRLLSMSAPNDPLNGATLYLADNIVLHADAFYGSAASSASAIDISNPIFWGPNSTAFDFTGDFFSHGYFTGPQVAPLMLSNLSEVVLGQDQLGSGLQVFGGMTTDNFHLPQPAAHALLENIIYYTAYTRLN
jgi:hypothetical protein